MHYPDGTEVKCGDYVQVEGEWHGVVVVDADSKESIPPFDTVHIETIGSGIMIKTKEMGLVVYYEFEPSLKMISRTKNC